jgi:hypothetical protein
MPNLEPYSLYEVQIESLVLTLKNGSKYEFPDTLANGRSNYILFEELVRALTGLTKTAGSDHTALDGTKYEQKAFKDTILYPGEKNDLFQTSASSTFGANNNGPRIKRLLETNDYESALKICRVTGYDHNDFYIYTNTKGFKPTVSMKYFVVPTIDVISNLNPSDPRQISRKKLLAKIKKSVQL